MCAIAGIWTFNEKLTKETLVRFTDSLSHRGPDGFGYYINQKEGFGVGHRRLSILDVKKRADQPMQYGDGRYTIVFNGEIYNFLELRKELESYGYSFHTTSDTEVLLASYNHWGKECLHKFNGMWAFAIWDKKRKKLFLSRDRFGIKPLYYLFIQSELFAFASETYAFQFLNGFQREVDGKNLKNVFIDNFSLEGYGKTIFKNIFSLLPGHYMEVEDRKIVEYKRWWNTIDHISPVFDDYKEQVQKFSDIFSSSCALRLRSDVSLATALSGGIDSSSVYSMVYTLMKNDMHFHLKRTPKEWQRAFVGSFPGSFLDERKFAEQEIRFIKGQATYVLPDTSHMIDEVIKTTKLFDSIYFTPLNAISNVYGSMKKQHIKISLDGHGVDEMMYGYPHLVEHAYRDAVIADNGEYIADIEDIYTHLFINKEQKKWIGEMRKRNPNIFFIYIRNLYHKARFIRQNYIYPKNWTMSEAIMYDEFHHHTLPTILRNLDRASMMHGVEIRMPFMDWRLVTYIFSLPMTSKIGNGYTKRILRDAMRGLVPDSILKRKSKIGFNAPTEIWFNGPLKEFIFDIVHSQAFLQSPYWNGKKLREFAEKRMMNNNWTWQECIFFWPYINAYILSS